MTRGRDEPGAYTLMHTRAVLEAACLNFSETKCKSLLATVLNKTSQQTEPSLKSPDHRGPLRFWDYTV